MVTVSAQITQLFVRRLRESAREARIIGRECSCIVAAFERRPTAASWSAGDLAHESTAAGSLPLHRDQVQPAAIFFNMLEPFKFFPRYTDFNEERRLSCCATLCVGFKKPDGIKIQSVCLRLRSLLAGGWHERRCFRLRAPVAAGTGDIMKFEVFITLCSHGIKFLLF